jgi:bifunctional pyridoxal-dependent enzyme with beta-cystathionase and maltose regulon repressor activities
VKTSYPTNRRLTLRESIEKWVGPIVVEDPNYAPLSDFLSEDEKKKIQEKLEESAFKCDLPD